MRMTRRAFISPVNKTRREIMTKRRDYDQIGSNGTKALNCGYAVQSGLPNEPDLAHLRVLRNDCAYCRNMLARSSIEKGIKVDKVAPTQARISGGNLFNVVGRVVLVTAESVMRAVGAGLPVHA